MKSEQLVAPEGRLPGIVFPMAWILVAVAAPALLVWMGNGGDDDARGNPGHLDEAEAALAEQRSEMSEWLGTYGWVDRQNGIARVPVEQAMQTVLRKGLPTREDGQEQK